MAITTTENTLSTIPFFTENQVLRASDLNNLVEAVFDQLRQNRIFNIGLGIVEGFAVSTNDLGQVVINRGYGVSSDGYAFDLGECTLTHFRKARGFAIGFHALAGGCTEYKKLLEKIDQTGYELAAPTPTTAATEEWISLAEENEQTGFIAEGRYCLLYLYREAQIDRSSCFSDCEAKGADQIGNYHAILLPVEQPNEEEPVEQSRQLNLPRIPALPVFGILEGQVKLCRIRNWQDLYLSYRSTCLAIHEDLARAYGAASLALEATEESGESTPEDTVLYNKVLSLLENLTREVYGAEPGETCTDIQYLHAYYSELVTAYAAFYHLMQGQTVSLGSGSESANENIRCAFSGHLKLRTIFVDDREILVDLDTSAAADPCRSVRIYPDNGDTRQSLLEAGRELLARMRTLANRQNLRLSTWGRDDLTEIRLTPDARRHPFLRGRALPFYYAPSVGDTWRVGEQPNSNSYRYAKWNSEHPLLSVSEDWDFYRIEGHLSQPLELIASEDADGNPIDSGAKAAIIELRNCLNLAFNVVDVSIDDINGDQPGSVLSGSDRDNWYKNFRNDVLGEILPRMVGGEVDPDDEDNTGFILATEVMNYLLAHPHLHSTDDWMELEDTTDSCTSFPANLTSPSLDQFVLVYQKLSRFLEDERLKQGTDVAGPNSGGSDDVLPYLDYELAECVRKAAVEERKHLELIRRRRYFAGLAKEHPGLVHLGGVPRGGTFVLVHKTIIARTELIISLSGRSKELAAKLEQQTDAQLFAQAREAFGDGADRFQIREVVADFCLPYLCCGAGAVNLFVVPKEPPPPLQLILAYNPCLSFGDDRGGLEVTVKVNDPDGQLSFFKEGIKSPFETFAIENEDSSVLLTSLTEDDFSGGRLLLSATYTKDTRTANSELTVYLEPSIRVPDQQPFLLPDPPPDTSGRDQYRLEVTVVPDNADLSFTVGEQAVDYDEVNNILFVRRELTFGGTLLITAVIGDCTTTQQYSLPSIEDDNDFTEDDLDIVIEAPNDPPAMLLQVLEDRRDRRQEMLREVIETEGQTADGEVAEMALDYINKVGTEEPLRNRLGSILLALSDLLEVQPERKDYIGKVAKAVATAFLDGLAAGNGTTALQAPQVKAVKKLRQRLATFGIDRESLLANWRAGELTVGLSSSRLEEIDQLIKAG